MKDARAIFHKSIIDMKAVEVARNFIITISKFDERVQRSILIILLVTWARASKIDLKVLLKETAEIDSIWTEDINKESS